MIIEIKIPSPGESIAEVEIGKWLVEDGANVLKDQEIAEIESDKATLSLIATHSGMVKIVVKEGEKVSVGSVACTIDSDVSISPAPKIVTPLNEKSILFVDTNEKEQSQVQSESTDEHGTKIKMTPTAKKIMEQENLSYDDVFNGLKRLTRQEMEQIVNVIKSPSASLASVSKVEPGRDVKRTPMSALRRKLSQRLVSVKNETAMLTTFNEIDMSQLMDLRKKFQQSFTDKHGLKLGFNSFFAKAASIALFEHPSLNSMIDGEDILESKFHDIGIAVQTPKGLMVPIIRNVEIMGIAEIEIAIKEMADKAREKRLGVQEMTGGTFTITNGGVFGSLLSTPIINPPQSAILGMHTIKERPIAVDGKVEIRPMMYVALSYDHRLIDGKDSVGFLVKVKEMIENPYRLLFQGKSAEEILLQI